MFGLGNNSQNSQGAATMPPTNNSTTGATNNNTSPINGYSSPYLSPEKDLHLSNDTTTPASNQSEYVNVSQEIANKTELPAPTPTSSVDLMGQPALEPTLSAPTLQSPLEATLPEPKLPDAFAPVILKNPFEEKVEPLQTAAPAPMSLGDLQAPSLSPQPASLPPLEPTFATQPALTPTPAPIESQTLPELQPAPTLQLSPATPQPTFPELKPALQPQIAPSVEKAPAPLMAAQSEPQIELRGEIPSVESLANPVDRYSENPMFDKTLDPEKDLGINREIISTLIDEKESDAKLKDNEITINQILSIVVEKDASDLHLTVGYPPKIRIDGKLQDLSSQALTAKQVESLIFQTISTSQKELLEVNRELDLSYAHEKARFRINAYYERGNLAAAYRLIPTKIRTIEDLGLPNAIYDFTELSQGLFLLTGPTGSGKSTTIAAMIKQINETAPVHIVTIEDPIEYIYPKGKALVDQRELGQDTHDWGIALRSILRQDPNIVVIGEMRDFETIQSALTIAETGHLVFATLHTNSAAESIDRIIDVFPPHQQSQVRVQLASSLKGIMSQRLIPLIGGGREAATELLIVTPAVQNLIREAKTYQIDNVVSTSYDLGMVTLERSLVKMIRDGKISVETAQEYAIRPKEVLKLMKSNI
jgi:twitching motility protein PilT